VHDDLLYIARHMREIDRSEIFGMRWDDDPDKVAGETLQAVMAAGTCKLFYADNPAAVLGAVERHPGVWNAFAYGTDEWPKVIRRLSVYAKTVFAPWLFARAHRIEAQSRFDHVTAHRWLEWLGAERESTLRGYGRDGSDYFNYAWTKG